MRQRNNICYSNSKVWLTIECLCLSLVVYSKNSIFLNVRSLKCSLIELCDDFYLIGIIAILETNAAYEKKTNFLFKQ